LNGNFQGSVEIPDLTSLPEIHDEPVFDGYRKGDMCRARWQDRFEKRVIRPSLKCRSGWGEVPENVMKNDDFYRAKVRLIPATGENSS